CFLAPISSPKSKHIEKCTGIDAIKIGKNLGVINLNNMIPVPTTQFKPIDFEKIKDERYIKLLKRQLFEMNKIKNNIEYKSMMIFNIATNPKNKVFTNLKHRCCDYKLLTYKAENYRFYKKQVKKQKKQDRLKLNKTKSKNRRN
ncbi:type III toxin-antitoxin system ToxN/AbiQ family toxin, partial [Granulicatella balaenopterae]